MKCQIPFSWGKKNSKKFINLPSAEFTQSMLKCQHCEENTDTAAVVFFLLQ